MKKVEFSKTDDNWDKKGVSTEGPKSSDKGGATIMFSLKNEIGGLVRALKLFQVGVTFMI